MRWERQLTYASAIRECLWADVRHPISQFQCLKVHASEARSISNGSNIVWNGKTCQRLTFAECRTTEPISKGSGRFTYRCCDKVLEPSWLLVPKPMVNHPVLCKHVMYVIFLSWNVTEREYGWKYNM